MTEVVSYRINDKNSITLERVAKKRGMAIATLTSKIIDDYLNYNLLLEESGYVYVPKVPLKILLKLLDESKLFPIIESSVIQIRLYLILYHGKITDEVVLDGLRAWCDGNRFSLEIFEENDNSKIVCNHGLGLNWSKIIIGILSELFVSEIANSVFEEDFISFTIHKKIITNETNADWIT